jgi:hypothetical protein
MQHLLAGLRPLFNLAADENMVAFSFDLLSPPFMFPFLSCQSCRFGFCVQVPLYAALRGFFFNAARVRLFFELTGR